MAVQVEGLVKSYGSNRAVDGISFSVPKGSVFGMLGPNGAGKSTTIEILVGLRKRDSGNVSVLGFDPGRDSSEFKSRIGVQLQTPSLYPKLTVREIVGLFSNLFPKGLKPMEVIDRVGLNDKANARVNDLSGGQQHRLAIAIAMVNDGDMVFLDEPTTGLDPQARRNLWDVIQDLRGQGKTVFLSTHFMDEAEKLCDSIIVVDHGKIIAQGSPKQLIDEYFSERAIDFSDPGGLTREDLDALPGVVRTEFENGIYTLFTGDIGPTVASLMDLGSEKSLKFQDMTVRSATLEDVFIKLTGRRIRE